MLRRNVSIYRAFYSPLNLCRTFSTNSTWIFHFTICSALHVPHAGDHFYVYRQAALSHSFYMGYMPWIIYSHSTYEYFTSNHTMRSCECSSYSPIFLYTQRHHHYHRNISCALHFIFVRVLPFGLCIIIIYVRFDSGNNFDAEMQVLYECFLNPSK